MLTPVTGSDVDTTSNWGDLTYELSNLRYRDLWLSNENANQLTTHSVLFEAAYTLPVLAR